MDEDEYRSLTDEARGGSLVSLAELLVEGVAGTTTHTVDQLATQLGECVVFDDIGRRCVTRDKARELVAAATERAQRAAAQRAQELEAQRAQRDHTQELRRQVKAIKASAPDGLQMERPDWGPAPFIGRGER